VLDVLRNYHRSAWLTQQQGPEADRRILDKATVIMHTGHNFRGHVPRCRRAVRTASDLRRPKELIESSTPDG
jgi:hypothetical protein